VLLLIAGQPGQPGQPGQSGQPPRIRRVALTGLAVLWLLVGAALVRCDYHWFTDVAAGWALAAIIVQVVQVVQVSLRL
jgi:membrane-associated phospholipid phosphatase